MQALISHPKELLRSDFVASLAKRNSIEIPDVNDIATVKLKINAIRSHLEEVFPIYTDIGYKIREALYLPESNCNIFIYGSGSFGKFTEGQPIQTKNIQEIYINNLASTSVGSFIISSNSSVLFEVSIESLDIIRKIQTTFKAIDLIHVSENILYGITDDSICKVSLMEDHNKVHSEVQFEGEFSVFKYSYSEWLLGTHSGTIVRIDKNQNEKRIEMNEPIRKLKYSRSEASILALVSTSVIIFNMSLEITRKYQLNLNPISLVMTENEKYIVVSTEDGKIATIDTINDQIITIPVHNGRIVNFVVDKSFQNIITFGNDSKISKFVFPIKAESMSIACHCLNFKFIGQKTEIVYIEGKFLKKWDYISKNTEILYESDNDLTKALHYNSSKDLLMFSDYYSVILFQVKTKVIVSKFNSSRKISIINITSDTDGSYFFTLANDNTFIYIYSINKQQLYGKMKGHEGRINCQIHIKSTTFLATGGNDRKIIIWDYLNEKMYIKLLGHSSPVTTLTTTREANKIISGSKDFSIKVWLWRSKQLLITLNSHISPLCKLFVDSNNNLTSVSIDGTLMYWNIRAYVRIFQTELKSYPPSHFTISSDNNYLAYSNEDEIRILNYAPFSNKIDVIGPNMQEKYEYMAYIMKILKGENIPFIPKWLDWAILPYQINTLYLYSYTNNYRYIKYSIQYETSIVPSTLLDPFSLVTGKNYQRCLKVIFDSTKKLLRINKHALSFLNQTVLVELNRRGHSQLHTFYNSIFNKYPVQDFPKFVDKNLLPKICLSRTLNPVFNNFFEEKTSKMDVKSTVDLRGLAFDDDDGEEDFFIDDDGIKEKVPIVVYTSSVRMILENGSIESIDFIRSLLECSNKEVFRTRFVQTLLKMKWKQIRVYQIIQAACFSIFLFSLAMYIIFLYRTATGMIMICSIGTILFVFDALQLFKGFILFWKDLKNLIDISRLIFLSMYFICYYFELPQERYVLIFLIIISALRGVSFLRLFDETRYITLLLRRVVEDMKSFAIILTYTTFIFSLILMVQNPEVEFITHLKAAYMLDIGDYNTDGYDWFGWVIFVFMTILNLIILLNMLIAIMGETFQKVRENSDIADFIEIAEMIIEIETMIGGRRSSNLKLYLQSCEAESIRDSVDEIGKDVKAIKDFLMKRKD